MIQIYLWELSLSDRQAPHISLYVGTTAEHHRQYMSWGTTGDVDKTVLEPTPGSFGEYSTAEEERLKELGEPIEIEGLDEDAVHAWLDRFRALNPPYDLGRMNCATVLAEALRAGGADQYVDWPGDDYLWTPYRVWDYARKLKAAIAAARTFGEPPDPVPNIVRPVQIARRSGYVWAAVGVIALSTAGALIYQLRDKNKPGTGGLPSPAAPASGRLPAIVDESAAESAPSGDGTGSFRRLARQARTRAGRIVAAGAVAAGTWLYPATAAGTPLGDAVHFVASTTGEPVAGGVILGNPVRGDELRVKSADLRMEGGKPVLDLTLVALRGPEQRCRYDGFTVSELSSAYHVVRPTPAMRADHDLADGECNLISCEFSESGTAHFAVHPALADTPVGAAAMWLDMLLLDPASGRLAPELRAKVLSLQWSDAPARLAVRDGRLTVAPASGSERSLLRLRLWGIARTPPWEDTTRPAAQREDSRTRALNGALRQFASGLPDEHPYLPRETLLLPEFALLFLAEYLGDLPDADALVAKEYEHPAFRKIDRFARLLAVLKRVAADTGGLPPLPASVQPVRHDLPPHLRNADLPAPPAARPATPALPDEKMDREQWWLVRQDGKKIGFEWIGSRSLSEDGGKRVEIARVTETQFERGGSPIVERDTARVVVASDGTPVRYHKTLAFPGSNEERVWDCVVGPDGIRLDVTRNGRKTSQRLALVPGIQFFDEWESFATTPMKPGESRRAFVTDVRRVAPGDQTLTAVKSERTTLLNGDRELLRVERTLGTTTEVAWFDDAGRPQKRVIDGTLTLLACTREEALAPNDRLDVFDGIFCEIPGGAGDLGEVVLRIRLDGENAGRLIPQSGNQRTRRIDDATVEARIARYKLDDVPARDLYQGNPLREPPPGRECRDANALIDSASPAVQAIARKCRTVSDPWRQALELESEVAGSVRPNYGIRSGGAAQAAERLEGDCRAVAALLAALARAKGIPARVAQGLCYSLPDRAFLGHAWTEVWVKDCWRPLDGTRGLGGIPATHVKLGHRDGTESDEDPIGRLFLQRRIAVEFVSVRPASPPGKTAKKDLPPIAPRPIRTAQERAAITFDAFRLGMIEGGEGFDWAKDPSASEFAPLNKELLGELVPRLAGSWPLPQPPHRGHLAIDFFNAMLYRTKVRQPWGEELLRRELGADVAAAYAAGLRVGVLLALTDTNMFDPELAGWLAEPLTDKMKTAGFPAELLRPLAESLRRGDPAERLTEALTKMMDGIRKHLDGG